MNSPRVDMSLHSERLFWFWAKQSLLLLLNVACNLIVIGLTRPRNEPTIYHTRGEDANN